MSSFQRIGRRLALSCFLALLGLAGAGLSSAQLAVHQNAPDRLRGPVDVITQQRVFVGTGGALVCPVEHVLPARLQSVGVYSDAKGSVADPVLVKHNDELLKAARHEEQALSDALVALIRAPAELRGDAAACALRHLLRFAHDGAFLETDDLRGSGAVRLYSVTPLIVYLALRDAGLMPAEADRAMRAWIAAFAARLEDYELTFVYTNNISDWTMAGVALAGVALDDRAMLDRAIDRALQSGYAVTAEGVLPLEMARGDMALAYSLSAAQALSVTVAVPQVNGRDLLAEPDGASLLRLFARLAQVIDDPQEWVRMGGSPAAIDHQHVDRQALGFLMIYYRATHDLVALRAICASRPMESFRIGGDWFVLFGTPGLCPG